MSVVSHGPLSTMWPWLPASPPPPTTVESQLKHMESMWQWLCSYLVSYRKLWCTCSDTQRPLILNMHAPFLWPLIWPGFPPPGRLWSAFCPEYIVQYYRVSSYSVASSFGEQILRKDGFLKRCFTLCTHSASMKTILCSACVSRGYFAFVLLYLRRPSQIPH